MTLVPTLACALHDVAGSRGTAAMDLLGRAWCVVASQALKCRTSGGCQQQSRYRLRFLKAMQSEASARYRMEFKCLLES